MPSFSHDAARSRSSRCTRMRHATRTIELMIGCAVRHAVRCRARGSRDIHRCRAHPRLGLGGAGLHRGRHDASARLLRGHRPIRASRSSAIPKPPEGADVVHHGVDVRQSRPQIRRRCARDELAAVIRETAARGGRVLIPAFAVGRTQELVYDLHVLARGGRDSGDPDLHRQPARDRHDVGVRDASRGLRSGEDLVTNGRRTCSDSSSCTTRVTSRSRRRSPERTARW